MCQTGGLRTQFKRIYPRSWSIIRLEGSHISNYTTAFQPKDCFAVCETCLHPTVIHISSHPIVDWRGPSEWHGQRLPQPSLVLFFSISLQSRSCVYREISLVRPTSPPKRSSHGADVPPASIYKRPVAVNNLPSIISTHLFAFVQSSTSMLSTNPGKTATQSQHIHLTSAEKARLTTSIPSPQPRGKHHMLEPRPRVQSFLIQKAPLQILVLGIHLANLQRQP